MKIKRREFVKLFGGVSGAIALSAFGLDQVIDVPDEIVESLRNGNGIETWKNTICRQCPGGCGIRVRLIDDIPVFIKGNPIYPVNHGGMCPLGRSSLQVLYNPDRLRTPVRRIGIPGSGRWEAVGWDEALDSIQQKLVELRQSGRSQEVAFLGSDETDLMHQHVSRFMTAYGSPNYYRFSSAQNDTAPFLLVQGKASVPSYDFLGARIILSFGANYLEEGSSPVYYTKLYSRLREASDGSRTRFIHVDSRMSLTAANADRWVPIRPGTYGALALGIAYVLIREELFDATFVRAHTFGFEDWTDRSGQTRTGFRTLVEREYYPERVSELTGVPSRTILEIAREIGITRPSVVLGDQGVVDSTNGTFAQMAVHSLNALLGNFEQEGGVIQIDDAPVAALPAFAEDDAARTGNARDRIGDSVDNRYPFAEFSIDTFTENILSDRPYTTSLLFLLRGNPLFQTLNHRRFSEALRHVPFVVSFDSFINETNEYADLILPDTTFLESWDEVSNVPAVAFSQVGIQQPVISPFYESRQAADVLIDLADRMGGTVESACAFGSYQEQVMHRARGLYESGAGAIASENVRRSWLEFLQQRGWHIGRYDSFTEFWGLLTENGGWWNPVRSEKSWSDVFGTGSGRFEFFARRLSDYMESAVRAGGDEELLLSGLKIQARDGVQFLPHHEPVEDDDGEEYPLFLTTFQSLTNRDGHGSNQPLMQEMFGYNVRQYWSTWAELHPETASEFGISEDEWIWIHSSIGSIRVQARIHPGIMPHVVAVPFGLGHTSYGRYAAGHGENPNSIIKHQYDLLSGKPALQATKVRIDRVA